MQRASDAIPSNLPLGMMLTMKGAASPEGIIPPDATVQFTNLQHLMEEGILMREDSPPTKERSGLAFIASWDQMGNRSELDTAVSECCIPVTM